MADIIDADHSGTVDMNEFRHFIVQMVEGVQPKLILELYYKMTTTKYVTNKCMDKIEAMHMDSRESAERNGLVTESVCRLAERMSALESRLEHMDESQENLTACVANWGLRQEDLGRQLGDDMGQLLTERYA